ncbi:MAG: 3-hydroxyacyl-CoA dehydrogenase NAD-binding domain-containing protein [Phycisphaerae bacterium]
MKIRTEIRTVAVLGAGTMGAGIAQTFAQGGRNVLMHDTRAGVVDHAVIGIEKSLEKFVAREKISKDDAAKARERLRPCSMSDLARADLVIEAIIEDPAAKAELWREINTIAGPDVIFASNTSSISISELGAASSRPAQFIGMHFFNPVPLMKLVEVVVGLETSEAVTNTIIDLARQLGKTPHRVKDYPGFVSNRVLMPMINEAIACYSDGVADADTIDNVMMLGCNHPMGPLKLADMIGLDVCLAIMEVLHRDLGEDRYRPTPLLRIMVRSGKLGNKSGKGFYSYDH